MTNDQTPSTELTFGDAVKEVQSILNRLEEEEVDIDDLAKEVARAVELIESCRTKLDKTDGEVRALVNRLVEANSGKEAN